MKVTINYRNSRILRFILPIVLFVLMYRYSVFLDSTENTGILGYFVFFAIFFSLFGVSAVRPDLFLMKGHKVMRVSEREITISGKRDDDKIVIDIEEIDKILLVYKRVRLYLVFVFKDKKELEIELTEFWFHTLFDLRKSMIQNYQKFTEITKPFPRWVEKIDELHKNELLIRFRVRE